MEQIFADLDRAVGVWVSLKDEGYGPGDVRVSRAYGEVVGIARGIGRFGWIEGVSSYRPNAGMKAAIRASLARVREVGESG